jgi:hypothetical protein
MVIRQYKADSCENGPEEFMTHTRQKFALEDILTMLNTGNKTPRKLSQ